MTAIALLSELRQLGIHIQTDGYKLQLNAPSGALTDELRDKIKAYKAELLKLLTTTNRETGEAEASETEPCPTCPCPFCHNFAWWERPTGGWVCGRCHPDPRTIEDNPVQIIECYWERKG